MTGPGPGVLSSGERAFHLHGGYNDRILQLGDHVQIETTPNVRYYHARFMRPIKAGQATDADHEFVQMLIAIQDRALAEVGPDVPAVVPDRLYREGVLEAGWQTNIQTKPSIQLVSFSILIVVTAGGNANFYLVICAWYDLAYLCFG